MAFEPDKNTKRLDRFLSTDGTTSGTKEANVDGSVTPVLYKINPPAVGRIVIVEMIIKIRDNAAAAPEKYGGLAELTTGIKVGMWDDENVLMEDFLDGINITANADWGRYDYDVQLLDWGSGNEVILSRWMFGDAGPFIVMNANDALSFGVLIQDDLTGLVSHTFNCEGYERIVV